MLGPGSYSSDKIEIAPLYKFRPSCNFISKTKRSCYIPENKLKKQKKPQEEEAEDSDDETIPGPGCYYDPYRYSSFSVHGKPQRLQFFGST